MKVPLKDLFFPLPSPRTSTNLINQAVNYAEIKLKKKIKKVNLIYPVRKLMKLISKHGSNVKQLMRYESDFLCSDIAHKLTECEVPILQERRRLENKGNKIAMPAM